MSGCSAVLVNYHGAGEIAQAVQSILRDSPHTEIIVVDNSDDVAEFRRLTHLLPSSVLTLDAGGNLGFGRACNLGWEASASEFVFFVNPDVRILSGCTDALVSALKTNASLAAVSPRQFLDSECCWHLPAAWLPTAIRVWASEVAVRNPTAAQRLGKACRAENLRLWSATQPITQRALSGGVFMLRRAALTPGELPFDPRFFMYYEDSDLCLRLRRRGADMAVVPSAIAVHAWHNLPHKVALMEQGGNVFFDKHYASGSPWLRKSRMLAPPPAYPGGFVHAPVLSDGVHVPTQWQDGWLLELSPSPLIQPAAGMVGSGSRLSVSDEVRGCFAGSTIFGRLSPLASVGDGGALLFYWS